MLRCQNLRKESKYINNAENKLKIRNLVLSTTEIYYFPVFQKFPIYSKTYFYTKETNFYELSFF